MSGDDDRFWDGLAAEIDHFSSRAQRSGANAWALVAALAGLSWLTVGAILSTAAIRWHLVAHASYQILAAWTFASTLIFAARGSRPTEPPTLPRTKSLLFRGAAKHVLGLVIAGDLFHVALSLYIAEGWARLGTTMAPALRATLLSLFLLVFLLLPDAPTDGGARRKVRISLLFYASLCALGSLVALNAARQASLSLPSMPEFTIAVYPGPVLWLLLQRALVEVDRDVIGRLIDVRRAVYFDQISTAEAKARLELILLGVRLGELFRSELDEVNFHASKAAANLSRAEQQIASMLALVEDGVIARGAQRDAARALRDKALSIAQQSLSAYDNAVSAPIDRIQRRLSFLETLSGRESLNEFVAIRSRIIDIKSAYVERARAVLVSLREASARVLGPEQDNDKTANENGLVVPGTDACDPEK